MAEQLNLAFRLPAVMQQDGKWFYSSCPMLDVHSQGLSHAEALSNLKDALELFLVSCIEMGILNQFLTEQGFTPGTLEADEVETEYVNVPISLIARKHAAYHAH